MPTENSRPDVPDLILSGSRAPFRGHSLTSDVTLESICGLASSDYRLAYEAALKRVAAGAP